MRTKPTIIVRQIWFTNSQLCDHFGIHRATLWRWKRHREFPRPEGKYIGLVRYDVRKVELFLQSKL
ncbi:hypothetical protein D5018_11815 [Parashewanella curva]|uniref:Helix-turn-helix domain-containing protein n=1 Tax=Parashewanella curva TaxID=2338552 RepID=A0A3L8PVW2_9GAMM|nr:hypothetical protein [Parashewanella curva]RLV59466.1 hypothetical protein D5018_11815 [Parashewanella curva]